MQTGKNMYNYIILYILYYNIIYIVHFYSQDLGWLKIKLYSVSKFVTLGL